MNSASSTHEAASYARREEIALRGSASVTRSRELAGEAALGEAVVCVRAEVDAPRIEQPLTGRRVSELDANRGHQRRHWASLRGESKGKEE
eukprot:scaffold297001_cov32-Tisochrysis_lutea.AAC.2